MALSNSTDFALNRDQIIGMALRDINVLASGETPTNQELSDASLSLNSMIKSWIADGLQLWVIESVDKALVADQVSYTVGLSGNISVPRPQRIDMVIYKKGTYERKLFPISRDEYKGLSDKTAKGAPTSYYYDPQLTNGVLYLWPVIDTVTDEEIEVVYQKAFDDLDIGTNNFEFPPMYYEAIRWNLAENLAHQYGVPMSIYARVAAKAQLEKIRVMQYDQEDVSLLIQPASRYYYGV